MFSRKAYWRPLYSHWEAPKSTQRIKSKETPTDNKKKFWISEHVLSKTCSLFM